MAGRRSKIKRLQPEVRSYIEQLLRADSMTLNEMLAAIAAKFPGADAPSRSGLHRYRENFEELVGRMREIEAVSNAVVGELGEGVGDKAGALLAQAITTLATNAALNAQTNSEISIEEIRKLARAAKDAMDARRISMAERQTIEKATREKLLAEQSKQLDGLAKTIGLSDAAVRQIRERLGTG